MVKSGDGEIRSAKVSLPSDKVLGRPLDLLYPIDRMKMERTNTRETQKRQLKIVK